MGKSEIAERERERERTFAGKDRRQVKEEANIMWSYRHTEKKVPNWFGIYVLSLLYWKKFPNQFGKLPTH